jgi:hypothetical protein
MNAAKDERKTLTPSFRMLIPQATSKKVENYLDARTGKSDVPLNCVICPPNVDPADAPDKYTRALWATSLETQHFLEEIREVYHLIMDSSTKTDVTTWFKRVNDGYAPCCDGECKTRGPILGKRGLFHVCEIPNSYEQSIQGA